MTTVERSADFGTRMRRAREEQGVTLREIADKTKISVRTLEGLERNDLSRLPGGIFSRAIVRSYASEVGLDPEATVREFIAQFPHDSVTAGSPDAPREEYEAVSSANDRGRMIVTIATMLIVAVVLLAIAFFVFGDRPA